MNDNHSHLLNDRHPRCFVLRFQCSRYVYNIGYTAPCCKRLYNSLQIDFRRATGDPPSNQVSAPGMLAPPFRRGVASLLLSDKYNPGRGRLQAPR
uniref:Uncharacterized protein n=1 Tax=Klebsiella phage vB_KpnM_Iguana_ER37 TaxID=3076781 RepID=A0AB38Z3V2_9CAUD